MIKVELTEKGEIEIVFDEEGRNLFIKKIMSLKEQTITDHVHFMAESWGGNELCDYILGDPTNKVVSHLRITFVPQRVLESLKKSASKI